MNAGDELQIITYHVITAILLKTNSNQGNARHVTIAMGVVTLTTGMMTVITGTCCLDIKLNSYVSAWKFQDFKKKIELPLHRANIIVLKRTVVENLILVIK